MEPAKQEVFKTWLIKDFCLQFEYAWHKICFILEPVESGFHAFPDSPPPLDPVRMQLPNRVFLFGL